MWLGLTSGVVNGTLIYEKLRERWQPDLGRIQAVAARRRATIGARSVDVHYLVGTGAGLGARRRAPRR
jgi:hypothetical protein